MPTQTHKFTDRFHQPCSATVISVGVVPEAVMALGAQATRHQMRITQKQMLELLPIFEHFARTGVLPPELEG